MIELTNKNDQNDLRDIILTLTSKYKVDYLFLLESLSSEKEESLYEIVLLLSNKETRSIGEIDPQITVDLRKYKSFHHVTFFSASVKEKLVQGNIFLFHACHPSRTLFKNPSCSFQLYPEEFTAKKNAVELQRFFDKENFKITEFRDGFDFYREKGNLSMAAFMLHQVFELRYRCMEILTLGKEKASHNIRSHHRYLGKTTGMLNTVFSEINDNDERLLSLLNETYCAVRYEDDFEISEEDINTLEIKMNALLGITEKLFHECLASFESEYIYNIETENVAVPHADVQLMEFPEYPYLKDILEKILSFSDIKEIYLISFYEQQYRQDNMEVIGANKRFVDYTLLLVSETDIREEISQLQNSLNGSPYYFVHLLGHSKLEIEVDLKKNKWFFQHALQKAILLYKVGSGIKWPTINNIERVSNKKKLEKIWRNWEERFERADGFLESANTIGCVENICSKTLMYNLALEQIFIGLLEYFYDYTPQKFALRSIFPIVAGIWEFPREIFPNNTSKEKKRWKMLTGILTDMRVKTDIDLDWSELSLISERCIICKKEANRLVREHYEALKTKFSEQVIEPAD